MFTGIVKEIGTVAALDRGEDGARLEIGASLAGGLAPGDSVAGQRRLPHRCRARRRRVQGRRHEPDSRPDHARRPRGRGRVNLEPALRAGEPLAATSSRGMSIAGRRSPDARTTASPGVCGSPFRPSTVAFVVEHGSVTLDGVSLTVAATHRRWLRGLPDPGDARAHDPRRRPRADGERRARRDRPLRGPASTLPNRRDP